MTASWLPIIAAQRAADGTLTPIQVPETRGPNGENGWTPILGGELDGTRTLIKVVDWMGGQGVKPALGMYLGTTGYVATKAQAFNFNASKRIESYSVVTRTTAGTETGTALAIGEKKIVFTSAFPSAPRVIPTGRANISGRPVVAEVVSVAADHCVVRATQAKGTLASLLSTLFDLVGGITVDVLVIEA